MTHEVRELIKSESPELYEKIKAIEAENQRAYYSEHKDRIAENIRRYWKRKFEREGTERKPKGDKQT